MDYDSLTDQVNTEISSHVSKGTDWNAVPGGLEKVSSSAKGFAWGMGSGNVWICQLPCEGNWKQVKSPSSSALRDVITDDNNVYVLFQDVLAIKSSDNTDEWVSINLPDSIGKIISTASYIWGQAENKKYKLPKPGMTGNWIPVEDKLNVTITSASASHLYGVSPDGKAMVTDEAMQSSWSVVPEFGGKYKAILGDSDQTGIYGISGDNSLQRCLNGKCQGVDTKGYTPQNITIDPTSKQMWMTSTTPGKSGNIFSQSLATDYTDILRTVQPIDEKRDQAVKEAEIQFDQTTYSGIMSKQFEFLKKMINDLFKIKPASSHEADQKILEGDINTTNSELYILQNMLPFIQELLIVLLLTILVYCASDYLGVFTHFLAFAVLISGTVFFAVNK